MKLICKIAKWILEHWCSLIVIGDETGKPITTEKGDYIA